MISGFTVSLFIVLSISGPFAHDDMARYELVLDQENPLIKLVINTGENEFFISDEDKIYDLFERLILQLYRGNDRLYRNMLEGIKVSSVAKKYSDYHTYVIEFEFSIKRCSMDISEACELNRGVASVEILLGKRNFNEPLSIFSMPEIEIKELW